jgi:hypothetical protein
VECYVDPAPVGSQGLPEAIAGVLRDAGPLRDVEVTIALQDRGYRTYRDQWSVDELMLHPREAARFCDQARFQHGYFDVPDDIILRVILTRRKNPSG